MKQNMIDGLRKYPNLRSVNLEASINFLNSATDEDLREIGLPIFVLVSGPWLRMMSTWYKTPIDCSFVKDYMEYYGIPEEIPLDYKMKSSRLYRLLTDKPTLTAKEFLST